jgi:hypothetical protein
MPSATAAASSPAIMPRPTRAMSISGVTLFIRRTSQGRIGLQAPKLVMDAVKGRHADWHVDVMAWWPGDPSRPPVGYEFRTWAV